MVAVDLQEMAPLPGVTVVQGDITSPETVEKVRRALGEQQKVKQKTNDEKIFSFPFLLQG